MRASSSAVATTWPTARAMLELALKSWTTSFRQPYYLAAIIVQSAFWVFPALLATRALAGPDNNYVGQFASLAGTDNYLAYTTIGTVSAYWVGSVTQGLAFVISRDRELGTLGIVWSAPLPRCFIVLGRAFGESLVRSVQPVGAFLLAWAIFRFPLHPLLAPALAVIVSALAANAAVGISLSGVVVRYRDAGWVLGLGTLVAAALAGTAYPITVLPGWAQAVAQAIPLTWMIRGLRAALIFNQTQEALLSAAVLLAMTAAYGLAGVLLFQHMERSARRQGVLEAF